MFVLAPGCFQLSPLGSGRARSSSSCWGSFSREVWQALQRHSAPTPLRQASLIYCLSIPWTTGGMRFWGKNFCLGLLLFLSSYFPRDTICYSQKQKSKLNIFKTQPSSLLSFDWAEPVENHGQDTQAPQLEGRPALLRKGQMSVAQGLLAE